MPSQPLPSHLEGKFWREHRRAHAKRRQASLLLAVPLVSVFGLLDNYVTPEQKVHLWLIQFGILTPAILTLLVIAMVRPLHRWSELGVMLGLLVTGGCVTAMTLIEPLHYGGILLVVFASYTFPGLRFVHASCTALTVSLLYVVTSVIDASTPWPVLAMNILFLASCNVIGAFVCYVLERAARRDFAHTRSLGERHQLVERILHNVLPDAVVRRLRSSHMIADSHPDVTILFADIVDFTTYAAAVAPAQLVQFLDQVFTRFDRLAQKHGVEKIKTIGDAYMVAGGLHTRDGDHVRAVAEMALDMLDAVDTLQLNDGRRLTLRIGIHTGPVVAGVIGRTKFAYDLWGDTVNVASRLQSLTTPGTIQVSQSTYLRLRDSYDFSTRHVIPVKGRGELPCYLLLARRNASRRQVTDAVATRGRGRIGNVMTTAPCPFPAPGSA